MVDTVVKEVSRDFTSRIDESINVQRLVDNVDKTSCDS